MEVGEIAPALARGWKRLVAVGVHSETVEQARLDVCVVMLLFCAPDGALILQKQAMQ